MNKKELFEKADELIAQSNMLYAKLKQLANKQENIIYVPDNIQISKWPSIHNGKHKLYYASGFGSWVVGSGIGDEIMKCKLTPCKYEDLQPGDLLYRDDNNNPKFDDLIGYAIKLDHGYQFWDGKDCNYNSIMYSNNWKVEEL